VPGEPAINDLFLGSLQGLPGYCLRLSAGQQPAADGRRQRQAGQDGKQEREGQAGAGAWFFAGNDLLAVSSFLPWPSRMRSRGSPPTLPSTSPLMPSSWPGRAGPTSKTDTSAMDHAQNARN